MVYIGNVEFSSGKFVVIAGPCLVESEEETLRIATSVQTSGAQVLRGAAFKSRATPYRFQGPIKKAFKILKKAKEVTGLPLITEAVDLETLDEAYAVADGIQVVSHQMQNFPLLRRLGQLRKPVILERGVSATIEEWLMAAEYILTEGNDQVILCERGVRYFGSDNQNRYLLDLPGAAFAALRSRLPVIVDPSFAAMHKSLVSKSARAALAMGVHGLMVDVHDERKEGLCDAPHAVSALQFAELMRALAPELGIDESPRASREKLRPEPTEFLQ